MLLVTFRVYKQGKIELKLKKRKKNYFRRNKTIISSTVTDGQQIGRVTSYKLLGFWVDDDIYTVQIKFGVFNE